MSESNKKYLFYLLMLIVHLTMSYYYFGKWWNSSLGTLLIVGICYVQWRDKFLHFAGLKIKSKTILVKIVVTTCLIVLSSYFSMNYIANKTGVEIVCGGWKNYFHTAFYILNEEIVFGAVILLPLVNKQRFPFLMASIALALVFSFGHFIFYKWIFLDKGTLKITTLFTLFFVGLLRNNIILCTRHIGYSWALHFGWMVVMFGCAHVHLQSNSPLSELSRFNMYLGSVAMFVISLVLAVISSVFLIKRCSSSSSLFGFGFKKN